MSFINLLTKFFSRESPLDIPLADNTEYKITTSKNEYQGLIIDQDDYLINFQNQKNKIIKILKSNIIHMSVVSPDDDLTANRQRTISRGNYQRHQKNS